MKKILTIMAFLIIGIAVAGFASATTPSEALISNSADLGQYTMTSSDTASITSGHVAYADLNSNTSTYRWAGLLGNATGNIVLGDNSNMMFSWSGATPLLVYASSASSVAWSSLADATNSNMPSYLTGGSDSDNYASTFTGSSEDIGSQLFSLSSDFATTLGSSTWKTYSLTDGSNLVWAGRIVQGGTSYSGSTVDYQMIIPEDGTNGDTSATAYNLWIELQ